MKVIACTIYFSRLTEQTENLSGYIVKFDQPYVFYESKAVVLHTKQVAYSDYTVC